MRQEYVQDLAGEDANIIFGAMYDDSKSDEATITVIATGLHNVGGTQSKLQSRLEHKATMMNGGSGMGASNISRPQFNPGEYSNVERPVYGGRPVQQRDYTGTAASECKNSTEQGERAVYQDSGFLQEIRMK